ncbi:unnamed protein product [Nesidiocoris tenuis]|uniref:Ketoreductase domain-containing protein n=1 Tax=Nesidiocoris tenuis TaxID=355587 RepID=A0A6H5GRM4_9HEMI|nr:unnamed protein product [Nesidiocoris tenuis]CAB0005528.1 unnamed protein product [Nesidiocoris tenuis]
MVENFQGKVVLVTGASSGIGAETARQFASLGASLAITGRNAENLQNVAKDCGQKNVLIVVGDVSVEEDAERIIRETIDKFGRLDVLVNNAGILENGGIKDTSLAQYDRIMAVNMRAVYHLTMLAVPHLIKTKGNIVNLSSVAGTRSFQNILSYCISKSALDQLTRCTALELAADGVRVNAVNPGVISTPIFERAGMQDQAVKEYLEGSKETHPLGRVGQPSEVANAIVFLASDRASFITGATLPIDGGRQLTCSRATVKQ